MKSFHLHLKRDEHQYKHTSVKNNQLLKTNQVLIKMACHSVIIASLKIPPVIYEKTWQIGYPGSDSFANLSFLFL